MIFKKNQMNPFIRLLHYISVIICFIFIKPTVFSQSNEEKRTVVQKAHYKQWNLKDFTNSDNENFKVKLYTVEDALTNTSHHWFLQVLTNENNYVNYGKITLTKGYLTNNQNIEFKFMNPIFSLCNEGKFIIGFVNVDKPGKYTINLEIENFGKKDTIELELQIKNT